MSATRSLRLALSVLWGVLAGLPAPAGADDTEVYLGAASATGGVRPNVLLILDTSGSMDTLVPGTGKDRLDNMKDAVELLLDRLHNVNVGLMRFHDNGGPVMYPVANIDGDASLVETGFPTPEVNVRVTDGADDVEQLPASGGTVDAASTRLELTDLPAAGAVTVRDYAISSNADDAEENVATGVLSDGDPTLDLDGGATPRLVGLRFQGVNVPRGSYILRAEIQFHASASDAPDGDFTLRGEDANDSASFTTQAGRKVSDRPLTTAAVEWSGVAPWTAGRWYQTPDLSAVVQEIVCRGVASATAACPDGVRDASGSWSASNDMTFVVRGDGPRRASSRNASSDLAPRLHIEYAAAPGGTQLVGLRFPNVMVPQGMRIHRAAIELTAAAASEGPARLRIVGEASDDAAPFATSGAQTPSSKRSARSTSASVTWDVPAWSAVGGLYQTPDLAAVVQEIVGRAGWCGGNDLVFLIERDTAGGPRIAQSYEGSPAGAPILRIDYDENSSLSAGQGCVVQNLQVQVGQGADDATEVDGSSRSDAVSVEADTVSLGKPKSGTYVTGLRFRGVPLPRNAQVVSASITLSAADNGSRDAQVRIAGEAADNATAFAATANNLSARAKTATTVTWSGIPAWSRGERGADTTTPDLGPLVQAIVNRAGWASGNSMVFLLTGDSGARLARSFEGSRGEAATLTVRYRGSLGAGTVPGGGAVTVRQRLKEVVDGLDHAGWTPLVDVLYEAARYYRGEGLEYGDVRGGGYTVQRSTRVSHRASYSGGTLYRPAGCTEADLSADACRGERIDGSPAYVSPIQTACASNYIILLTDGQANNNHSESLIRAMTGVSQCQVHHSDGTGIPNGERCGIDLGRFLYTRDQSRALPGTQTVTTYTIGFNLDESDAQQRQAVRYLQDLASASGGEFRTSTTAADLADTLQAIFVDILARPTSFVSPALTVNAFNRLYHLSDIYLSLFKPNARVRWDGNIKKYRVCASSAAGCQPGEILDANGVRALEPSGRLKARGIQSLWSDAEDGDEVTVGGAGNEGPAAASRRVLTFTGATPPVGTPFVDLGAAAHQLVAGNAALTRSMLGLAAAATDAERAAQIDWIRGVDVDDADDDEDVTEGRYRLGDPLHATPLPVPFGGTAASPVVKLFAGANDGAIRMLDGHTGEEEWAFFPRETLGELQVTLRDNPNGRHRYGIDGTPTAWVKDADSDGVIEAADGDFVRVLTGMRRGGDTLYGLDVTPTSPLTTAGEVRPVYPKYMWRINGGASGSTAYPRLGQTWSRPLVTTVRVGDGTASGFRTREVLLFGGGYHDGLDSGFVSGGLGNAIYIADPATGSRLFWISGNGAAAHGAGSGVEVADMVFPIPSDLTLLDANGDGATDRIYVADTGGQVWRVDLRPAPGVDGGIRAVVGKLASLSSTPATAASDDKRRFFYPPDVLQVTDGRYSSARRYDLVTLVSGDREHPVATTVRDIAYALRDPSPGWLADANNDGLAEGYTTILGPLVAAPTRAGDLLDVTDRLITASSSSADLTALRGARGWYVRFDATGEKGLAAPVTMAGTLLFTSYLPMVSAEADVCSVPEGNGKVYALDVLTAAPKLNLDGVGDPTALTRADRGRLLGGGIPSAPSPVFTEEGVSVVIGVGGGAETLDPGIGLPRGRTYWLNEE